MRARPDSQEFVDEALADVGDSCEVDLDLDLDLVEVLVESVQQSSCFAVGDELGTDGERLDDGADADESVVAGELAEEADGLGGEEDPFAGVPGRVRSSSWPGASRTSLDPISKPLLACLP
jgi:hypothetical protein